MNPFSVSNSSEPTEQSSAVSGISISDMLPDAKLIGTDGVSVTSCCGSHLEVEPGDLFVALLGANDDGHDFAAAAIGRGANAIVTERLLAIDAPQILVSDTRQAYGEICQRLAGNPSTRMTTVGVSGSDGKTVTSHLIQRVLTEAGKTPGIISSIEVNAGGDRQSVPSPQVNSPLIADQLSRMVLEDCNAAVVEISSRSLAGRAMSGINLDVAVLTNIRRDPDNFHGNSKNYRRAMERMIGHLKSTGVAVVNADDPKSNSLLDRLAVPTLTFGMKQEANVTAIVLERSAADQVFIISAGGQSVPVRTPIVGDPHIYNCLAATATGLAIGIDLHTIARGLESASKIAGRMQRVECGQPFGVWVDAASSPSQLAHALRTLKQVTTGNVWCVCSVEESQSTHQRQLIGEVVEKASHQAIVTRTAVDSMIDYEPIHEVLDGFRHPENARIIPNRFKAIEFALHEAQPGDAVLISGCGERPFALVGEHQWTINDRDVCQAWLYDHASMLDEKFSSRLRSERNTSIYNIDDYRG